MTSLSGWLGGKSGGYVVFIGESVSDLLLAEAIFVSQDLASVWFTRDLRDVGSGHPVAFDYGLTRVDVRVNLHMLATRLDRRPAPVSERVSDEFEVEQRAGHDPVLQVVNRIDVEVVAFPQHDELAVVFKRGGGERPRPEPLAEPLDEFADSLRPPAKLDEVVGEDRFTHVGVRVDLWSRGD